MLFELHEVDHVVDHGLEAVLGPQHLIMRKHSIDLNRVIADEDPGMEETPLQIPHHENDKVDEAVPPFCGLIFLVLVFELYRHPNIFISVSKVA